MAKLGTVVEEADESVFWLELLLEANLSPPIEIRRLMLEANQFVAIFSAAQLTVKKTLRQ